jgi:hypothetical protein
MNEKELIELRREIEKELHELEVKIYDLETSYLEETAQNGKLEVTRQRHQRLGGLFDQKHDKDHAGQEKVQQ